MYTLSKVIPCLTGRIGFIGKKDIDLNEVDSILYESKSGLRWEQGHALVTLDNLQNIMPGPEDAPHYPVFDGIYNYKIGDIVYAGNDTNTLYICIDSPGGEGWASAYPPGEPGSVSFWQETSPFAVWLKEKINASIITLLSSISRERKLMQNTKSLLESAQLYTGAGNYEDKELKTGRFVGFQLVFKGYQNLAATINQIGVQFSEKILASSGEPLKIYLYHTSQNEPVKIFSVLANKRLSVDWLDIEKCILGGDLQNDIGGAWFLGYYEDDIPIGAQAINRTQFNFTTGPCSTCSGYDGSFFEWFRFISILPFSNAELGEDTEIFNWNQNIYYPQDKTFGLNLRLSVQCDISNVICSQAGILDQALLMQFAVDMLTEMANSTRLNRIQEVVKTKAAYALEDHDKNKGMVSLLADEICAVNFDLSDLDKVCLPCLPGVPRVHYRSI